MDAEEKEMKRKQHINYINDYNKKTYYMANLRFNKVKDRKIIEKLQSVPSRCEYVRQLIKKDLGID